MKKIFSAVIIFLPLFSAAQRTGIGIKPSSRAILEVAGNVNGTIGLLGDASGLSVQTNPSIGFNVYGSKYMSNGYGATMAFDLNNNFGLGIYMHPYDVVNNQSFSGRSVFYLGPNGVAMNTSAGNAGYILDVGRGTGIWGTTTFEGTSYYSHFNYSTNEDTYIRGGKASSRVYFNDDPAGVGIAIGNGSSLIGVNYTNPVATFEIRQVGGTGISIRGAISGRWEWRVSGSPGNLYLYYNSTTKSYLRASDGAIINTSDKRIKEDIKPLPSILDKIMKLQPVTYEMNDNNPMHLRSTGFIAQEVQPLFPELVYTDTTADKKMALDYSRFGAIAVKGVQEEQVLINELQQNADLIEEKLSSLEKAVRQKKLIQH
ncbi:MAG: tail fiber domain-containing protein [Bacteroidota bacterium]